MNRTPNKTSELVRAKKLDRRDDIILQNFNRRFWNDEYTTILRKKFTRELTTGKEGDE